MPAPPPPPPSRILVVDDESSVRESVGYALEQEGFEVTLAADGDDAEGKLSDSHYDLLIIDIMMPGKSGLDVCREVRSRSPVPIILLTAKDAEVAEPHRVGQQDARSPAGHRQRRRELPGVHIEGAVHRGPDTAARPLARHRGSRGPNRRTEMTTPLAVRPSGNQPVERREERGPPAAIPLAVAVERDHLAGVERLHVCDAPAVVAGVNDGPCRHTTGQFLHRPLRPQMSGIATIAIADTRSRREAQGWCRIRTTGRTVWATRVTRDVRQGGGEVAAPLERGGSIARGRGR